MEFEIFYTVACFLGGLEEKTHGSGGVTEEAQRKTEGDVPAAKCGQSWCVF